MKVVDLTQSMTNGMPVMEGITPPKFHDLAEVRPQQSGPTEPPDRSRLHQEIRELTANCCAPR
jgi:hypothetical protein